MMSRGSIQLRVGLIRNEGRHVFKQMTLGTAAALLTLTAAQAAPQILAPPATPAASVQPYMKVAARCVILRHVRVIDGTGAPAREDQTILIASGKIGVVAGPDVDAVVAPDCQLLDLTGRTVLPGLVGMHDHSITSPGPTWTPPVIPSRR
jgi:imidazolonepropionase-like amidohydrolase